MEIIIHRESKEYPGYFTIPNNQYVVISLKGEFRNTYTGNPVKITPNLAGYPKICIRDKLGKYHNFLVHRLLALTFIGRPLRHLDKEY
jgi:hypothetical protein